MSLKVLLLVVLCYCPLIAQIKADCIIETPQDFSVRPKFFRNTETATALISDNRSQNIRLDPGESIIGHCRNRFVNPHNVGNTRKIKVVCHDYDFKLVHYGHGWVRANGLLFECVPSREFETCPPIQLSSNKALRPKIFEKIGTRSFQLSPEMATIEIKYGQEVTLQCDNKFKSPNPPTSELNLICINGRIVALDHPYSADYNNFECQLDKWGLYESNMSFPWCPSSMASYLLARPLAHNGYEYLAGICYDFDHMSLKSLYYAAKPKFAESLAPRILETFEPLMEISDIDEKFISKRSFVYDNQKMQKWFSFSNYETDSIVQYQRLHNDLFQQFEQLLNIDWWSGLKLENWELYEEALTKHIDNEDNGYDILAGVSKKVAVLIRKENCSKNMTMVEVVDSENNSLPLYVWNYLRSLKNSSDDVVVIGVNTPFSDFYDEKELMFCNDICHTIDWLKDVRMTFRYRSMGIIFCCTYNEVLASERLDGFAKPETPIPSALLPPILNYSFYIANTTTVETVESTQFEETTERELESEEYD